MLLNIWSRTAIAPGVETHQRFPANGGPLDVPLEEVLLPAQALRSIKAANDATTR
jgi:hypothetical protein